MGAGLPVRAQRRPDALAGLRLVPGAGDPRLAPQHRQVHRRPDGRPAARPDRRGREPAHDLLPQPAERGAGDRPDQTMRAITDVVKTFEMPGTGIPGFQRKAVEMAVAGHLRHPPAPRRRRRAGAAVLEGLRDRGPLRRGRAGPHRAGRADGGAWRSRRCASRTSATRSGPGWRPADPSSAPSRQVLREACIAQHLQPGAPVDRRRAGRVVAVHPRAAPRASPSRRATSNAWVQQGRGHTRRRYGASVPTVATYSASSCCICRVARSRPAGLPVDAGHPPQRRGRGRVGVGSLQPRRRGVRLRAPVPANDARRACARGRCRCRSMSRPGTAGQPSPRAARRRLSARRCRTRAKPAAVSRRSTAVSPCSDPMSRTVSRRRARRPHRRAQLSDTAQPASGEARHRRVRAGPPRCRRWR